MWRRYLNIETGFSDSDAEDVRRILDFHPQDSRQYGTRKIFNNASSLVQCLQKLMEISWKRQSFNKIRQAPIQRLSIKKHSSSKMFSTQNMRKSGLSKRNQTMMFRSNSQNNYGINKRSKFRLSPQFVPQQYLSGLNQSSQESASGKKILTKINNLQKLVLKIKKQSQICNQKSVIQPLVPQLQGYIVPQLLNQHVVESRNYMSNHYNGVVLPIKNYSFHDNKSQQLRIIQADHKNKEYKKLQKSKRLKTQQTIQREQHDIVRENLKQIRRDLQQLYQNNKYIMQRNIINDQGESEESQVFSYVNNHQTRNVKGNGYYMESPKVTLRQTQPTYRSSDHHQILNFKVQHVSHQKQKSHHINNRSLPSRNCRKCTHCLIYED